jgi:concanavalin A-like lectin/glucanase superfamily protein/GDSL-like lipase/acylhydrolase family protein
MSADSDHQALIMARVGSGLLNYWTFGEAVNPATLACAASVGSVNWTLGTSTGRPTLGVAGCLVGGTAIQGNGTTNFAFTDATLDLSGLSTVWVTCLANWTSYTNTDRVLFEHTTNFNSSAGGFVCLPNASTTLTFQASLKGNVGNSINNVCRPTVATWHHYAFRFDKTQTSREVAIYIDGVLKNSTTYPTDSNNTGTFAAAVMYLFARAGTSLFGAGTIQHMTISSALSAADLTAEAQSAGFSSRTAVAFTNTNKWYNGRGGTDSPESNTQATLKINTDGASLELGIRCDAFLNLTGVGFPGNACVGVKIDGVIQSHVAVSANGTWTLPLTLGTAGTFRNVELIDGQQLVGTGTYLKDVAVLGGTATVTAPVTTGSTVVVTVGNSITGSANATHPETGGWTQLLKDRGLYVINEAYGSRMLANDIADTGTPWVLNTTKSQAFADRLVGYIPVGVVGKIVLCPGTNDCALSGGAWDSTAYQAGYTDLLARLVAKIASTGKTITVYVVSAILRGTSGESAVNSYGKRQSDYRTAAQAAAATQATVVFIDGRPLCDVSKLDTDQTHPLDPGHIQIDATIYPQLFPSSSANETDDAYFALSLELAM